MSKVLEIAKNEIGYVETGDNSTKYGKWFGLDFQPWCAIFVSWCFSQAGNPLPKMGFSKGFASCQKGLEIFTKKNKITKDPKPGDLVFFDWDKNGKYDHVGFFEKWLIKNKTFQSIEGNTSTKDQRNGGMVMERIRFSKGVVFVSM